MVQIDRFLARTLPLLAAAVCAVVIPHSSSAAQDAALIKRGEYLATAGDCIACHTVPNGKPFAGGLYMPTPFGDISTPNITPDAQTGIGGWSDDEFVRAMHEGIGKHGEYLYPVFPFPWYTKVSRDDVLAIKAYLFSLTPVSAPRKPLKLSFPFSVRDGLITWRTLFFKAATFQPDPHASAQVNRGAYLVEGLGHCGECHNRENVFGASDWSGKLEGGEIEGWYAPNLTSNSQEGVGSWSAPQLVTFLKSGAAPGKGVVLGPMKDTIEQSLSHMSDEDLGAIAAYLKSVPAKASYTADQPSDFKAPTPPGSEAYLSHCAFCHRPDGKGVTGDIPALAGNGAVRAKGPENVIGAVLGGLNATHGLAPMPAVGAGLTDQQIADITNYVRTSWGNGAPVTAEAGTVAKLRADTKTMLAGNAPCDPIADPGLAKAVSAPAVTGELRAITLTNVLGSVDKILPQVTTPGVSDDRVVNALTSAYCEILPADAGKAEKLGNFSQLVYGQLTHRDVPKRSGG